jgi:hypothetical protein
VSELYRPSDRKFLTFSASLSGYTLLNHDVLEGFQVFTSVTMKNAVFWDVAPCFVKTNISEERVPTIFRVEKIHVQRKALAD